MAASLRTILVSYRRSDTRDLARRLYDALSERFPERVFMDVEEIEPGTDFAEAISAAIQSAGVLVAVIGDDWTGRKSVGRSRLLDEHDFVRLEIATALRARVRVIPVLAPNSELPDPRDLPGDVSALLRLQALSLTDAHLQDDIERLAEIVARHLGEERAKVALVAMPGPRDWTLTLQVFERDVREILYRVDGAGELRSTGFELARNPRTGHPLPRPNVFLPVGDAPRTIEVAYVDARGARQGPFALAFEPRAEFVRYVKSILGLTPWVGSGRDVDGRPLCYFSNLLCHKAAFTSVHFAFDDEPAQRALRFVPARAVATSELAEDDEVHVAVPTGAKRVRVRIDFVDGSSESAEFALEV